MNDTFKICAGSVADIRSGQTAHSSLVPKQDGAIRAISLKNLSAGRRIDNSSVEYVPNGDVRGTSLLRDGDLLFRSRGSRLEAASYRDDGAPTIAVSPVIVIRQRSDALIPGFLAWLINEYPPARRYIERVARSGATVESITVGDLTNLPVIVPSVEVQRKLLDIAFESHHIGQLLKRLEKAYTLRTAALYTALLDGANPNTR